MGMLVANCPRCGANDITFDIIAAVFRRIEYQWKRHFEICCLCRRCARLTLYVVSDSRTQTKEIIKDDADFIKVGFAINEACQIEGLVNFAEVDAKGSPEHLPADVKAAFDEGAKCLAIGCNNASAAMFRLSIDLATQPLLPDSGDQSVAQPNHRQRRDLGLRLPWLFENHLLPAALSDLAACIREDGNDGAHAGNLGKADAEDLMDFSFELLERLYTEPERLRLAAQRRIERRQG